MRTAASIVYLWLLALPAGAAGQAGTAVGGYPSKPIRLIDPFPPGGGSWFVGRVISQELFERWGQSIVIDNRPGAGGAIGTDMAARALPDGYTLVLATASTVAINPLLSKVAFDPVKDLAAVVHTTNVPLVLVVHPGVSARSVRELIALAKARPGTLNFASSGNGTISHLAGELFKVHAGVDMVHVPYKGGGPALIEVISGHVQLNFANMLSAFPHVKAGRLRGLAVSGAQRAPALSDVPTVAEAGVEGYEVAQWNGVLAPAGTPAAIIAKLNAEIVRILDRPEIRERLSSDGAQPVGGTPQQFAAFIKADIAKWAGVIKTANIRIE